MSDLDDSVTRAAIAQGLPTAGFVALAVFAALMGVAWLAWLFALAALIAVFRVPQP